MIFTDRFVYLHLPKTGGSFVTEILIRLHCPRPTLVTRLRNRAGRRRRRYPGRYGALVEDLNKHGIRAELPAPHRHKPILGTIRNPLDRFVSMYEFGWWRRPENRADYDRLPDFARRFPRFPDLSFEDYLRLEGEAFGDITPERFDDPRVLGLQTQDFVRQYAPSPVGMLEEIQCGVAATEWSRELDTCRFLRTSRLNDELHAFLCEVGYPPDAVAFVRTHAKVLPGKGRTADQRWEDYYTPTLERIVRQQERALFELFPDLDR